MSKKLLTRKFNGDGKLPVFDDLGTYRVMCGCFDALRSFYSPPCAAFVDLSTLCTRYNGPYRHAPDLVIPFSHLATADKVNALRYAKANNLSHAHRTAWHFALVPAAQIFDKEHDAIIGAMQTDIKKVGYWTDHVLRHGLKRAFVRGTDLALKAAVLSPPPPDAMLSAIVQTLGSAAASKASKVANAMASKASKAACAKVIKASKAACAKALKALDALPPITFAYSPYVPCLTYVGPLQSYRDRYRIVYSGKHRFGLPITFSDMTVWEQLGADHQHARASRIATWRLEQVTIAAFYAEDAEAIDATYARLKAYRTPRNFFRQALSGRAKRSSAPMLPLEYIAAWCAVCAKVKAYDTQALEHIQKHALVGKATHQRELKAWLIYETTIPFVPVLRRVW